MEKALEKPFDEQNQIFKSAINDWKGSLEQVDDILLLGYKIIQPNNPNIISNAMLTIKMVTNHFTNPKVVFFNNLLPINAPENAAATAIKITVELF